MLPVSLKNTLHWTMRKFTGYLKGLGCSDFAIGTRVYATYCQLEQCGEESTAITAGKIHHSWLAEGENWMVMLESLLPLKTGSY